MELFQILQKKSKYFYALLLLLGLINSVWASSLLILINHKINGEPLPFFNDYDWVAYVVLIVAAFSMARFFQGYMITLTYDLGNELNLSIFNRLRFTNFEDYQELGEERVRTAMSDVTTLQRFPQAFIESFNAAVMVLIGISYLLYINSAGALAIMAVLAVLIVFYNLRSKAIQRDLNAARDLATVYQRNVNDFLRGFKEVKMSTDRSDVLYHDYLTHNRNKVKTLTVRTLVRHMMNELLGAYSWYLGIGLVLFLLPVLLHTDARVSSSFVITLLYLMGPTNVVISEMHEFFQMRIALERLQEFNEVIDGYAAVRTGHGTLPAPGQAQEFESLRFENVTFEYYDDKRDQTFRLLPLNLEIKRGESIFVTGGNGSGKSTFINLLTGLYLPLSGNIYLNGHRIDANQYPHYRNQICAIFTDCHLFGENYNRLDLTTGNHRLVALLKKMQLTEVVPLSATETKLKVNLSKGQQKRLALINALLEDRDILVLDEWAAEQDPMFRAFFYTKIIPELRLAGKTVIAVTHDDAYFDCARRVLKFDYGRIAADTRMEPLAGVTEVAEAY
ncbi:cyclic peptide export ABC transporter [Hymenobacter actinosclerus]|uniref:Putative ATP-binding cassette transporter n=1 Tax=Hymenobacter actinosclerus TaxID=82805 RepID=A0A1I0IIK4_9BACT|nr:cyclic peptide export ABC transporter [Hymenobacter actinosclerus]SET96754.1 putative ATP-binding cassette transporter [Hymenobacter actinosclerus]